MSYDSVPGPSDPPGSDPSFQGQPGSPYGAPTGQPYAAPTGPYGPAGGFGGPGGPYGPYGGPGGPRRSRAGLIAGLVIGGVLIVVIAVVAVAVFAARGSGGGSGGGLDDLPAPKALGHDPVPAERTITTRPADCGVTKATVKALVHGTGMDGVGGNCSWSDYTSSTSRDLDVEYQTDEPSPDTTSKVAAAIQEFNRETSDESAPTGNTFKPLTGLGDDAVYRVGPDAAGNGIEAVVVFRAADLVTEVTYRSLEAKSSASDKFRDGAFRAAADAAKAVGAAAKPAVAQPGQAAPTTVPSDVCGLIPQDLFKTLSGESDPSPESDSEDEIIDREAMPSANTVGCRVSGFGNGGDRSMEVHVIGATKAGAAPTVARAYLGAYYEARAEKPTSGSGRYFQALSGLGDQAFCSYLDGNRGHLILGKDTAEIVVRKGTALITVTYGGEVTDSKLTQQQTIKGAYAVATKVAAGVK